MRIAVDAGHGINTAGKRTPDGKVREWTLNNRVAVAMQNQLQKYEGAQTLRLDDPTGKHDVDLLTRVKKATDWGADILISIHHNAFQNVMSSGHGGTETYYEHENSKKLAEVMLNAVLGSYGLRNRGVKRKAYDIINYFRNPSTLVECGFMDSKNDLVIHDDARAKKLGVAMANALAVHYGLTLKGDTPETPTKKTNEQIAAEVNNGDWDNGQVRKDRLTAAGYDYNAIQAIVNKGAGTTPPPKPNRKTNEELAKEVNNGDWGNGQVRKDRLTAAGYDYNAVQKIVNGGTSTGKDFAGTVIKMGIGTVLRDKNGSPYSLKLKSNATAKVLSQIGDGVNGNTLLRFKASWLIGVTEAYVYLKDVRF